MAATGEGRIAEPAANPYCPNCMKHLLTLLCCALPLVAAAEIYRYVDEDGSVHYTDEPPPEHKDAAETVDLEPLRTVESRAPASPPTITRSTQQSAKAGGDLYSAVKIARPLNEQTIRDASNTLTVVVQSEPALRTTLGHRVRFFLDGAAVNSEPIASNTITMREVYRGTHTVGAEIVDGQGRVIGSAEPATVYMKPPRVR